MANKRREWVIPKEMAVFRLDAHGQWHGPLGRFENRNIIKHFHHSIRRDEGGYYLVQTHRDFVEKVYFPYEDTALFVVAVVRGDEVGLLLNTGKHLKLRPRRLYSKEDNLYMRVGEERVKFTDHALITLSDLMEEDGEHLFIRVKGRRYRISEASDGGKGEP